MIVKLMQVSFWENGSSPLKEKESINYESDSHVNLSVIFYFCAIDDFHFVGL